MVFAVLAAMACWLGFGAAPSHADESTTITVTVLNRVEENGSTTRVPVEGVTLNVRDVGGALVGTGVTDATGVAAIDVGKPDKYIVAIDLDKLPEGVGPAAGEPTEREVDFNAGVSIGVGKKVSFFLGEDTRTVTGKWDLLPQTLANGLKLADHRDHVHRAVADLRHHRAVQLRPRRDGDVRRASSPGGSTRAGLTLHPAGGAASSASLAGALFGYSLELRRLATAAPARHEPDVDDDRVDRRRPSPSRYIFLFCFGGRTRARTASTRCSQIRCTSGRSTSRPRPDRSWHLCRSCSSPWPCSCRTRFGKAIRAVSDNPDLASSTGIDTDRVILHRVGARRRARRAGRRVLRPRVGIKWDMGFTLLLLMFAAITLGGLGNPFGALLGGLVIGMFVELLDAGSFPTPTS